MSSTIRLFEEVAHASIYRKFRPTYPQKLLDLISQYIKAHSGSYNLVVDVACGSGQSTFYLQKMFKKCIGVDISKAQVEQAKAACVEKEVKNVSFVEGSADKLPMETGSVDVVTIAQAWHWLEPQSFYEECRRVLRPGSGCLAVYGYGQGHLSHKRCDDLVQTFYNETLKGCWHENRRHIDNCYEEVVLPFKNTQRYDLSSSKDMSVDNYFGYLSTWSAYCKYCDQHPGNTELEKLKEKVKAVLLSEQYGSTDVQVNFPVFLVLGQN